MDSNWSDLYVFGREHYDGGASAALAVHLPTGEVRGLDVERDDTPMFFLNSSPREFADTVAAIGRALRVGASPTTELDSALESIDPRGYPRSEWRSLVAHLTSGT